MSIRAPWVVGPPYRRWNNCRSWFWFGKFYLAWFDKDTMTHSACKVLDALYGAIVLALWFEELDADPFAWGEGCCAIEADCTSTSRYVYDCPECDHWWRHSPYAYS